MFDFLCSNPKCNELFEELIGNDERTLPCPVCGQESGRQLAAPRSNWRKMGTDPGFPSAWDKWGKAKREHHAKGKDTMRGGKGQNLLMY
jgi:hypothetical protein